MVLSAQPVQHLESESLVLRVGQVVSDLGLSVATASDSRVRPVHGYRTCRQRRDSSRSSHRRSSRSASRQVVDQAKTDVAQAVEFRFGCFPAAEGTQRCPRAHEGGGLTPRFETFAAISGLLSLTVEAAATHAPTRPPGRGCVGVCDL